MLVKTLNLPSGAARIIAEQIVEKVGAERAILAVVLACGVLRSRSMRDGKPRVGRIYDNIKNERLRDYLNPLSPSNLTRHQPWVGCVIL